MAIFGELLATLKDHHGPNTQFQVIYEDLEMNDFNSLFKRMSGIIPDPPSYLQEMDNVYVLASGTNFYKQCVPSNSMHFMMSMTSVHWLSRTATTFKDSIYKDAKSSTEETAALNKQAELDWEMFLLRRSRELKRGGLLVVDSRSLEEKEQIVDGLYDDVKKRLSRMNPEIFKDDLRFIYLVIRKE
ncbi:benzoate carboxyl methyltransferase-like [Haliotis rubra]|uniref:benzoate carboxyl methyltransferase-like n=1 Tax=Haliotis rubra TaxID=36100 RepID=UPI001EE527DF|nr:benzoate carboxyl methyltransferase-like [Haliotis rubra]